MRTLLLFFLLLTVQFSFSSDYTKVDSIVKNYPKKFKSIENFAKKIESDFSTDIEKTRAAFYWIANNIAYDYEDYKSGKSVYKAISYNTKEEYNAKLQMQQLKYANQCLKKKAAICEGYSQLLKFTLLQLNIECEVVSGFTKSNTREIGRERHTEDHAWNAVKLNNKWELIDVTWSTGNRLNNPLHFEFTDVYFLPNPKTFILNHFPKDSKWQLLKKPLNKSSFFSLPIVKTTYFNSGLEISIFNKGTLKVKPNNTIKLLIKKIDSTKTYKYVFEKDRYNSILELKNNNKGYYFSSLKYNPKSGKTLMVLNNRGVSILEYKIETAN